MVGRNCPILELWRSCLGDRVWFDWLSNRGLDVFIALTIFYLTLALYSRVSKDHRAIFIYFTLSIICCIAFALWLDCGWKEALCYSLFFVYYRRRVFDFLLAGICFSVYWVWILFSRATVDLSDLFIAACVVYVLLSLWSLIPKNNQMFWLIRVSLFFLFVGGCVCFIV